jgi:hypothetical protein
MQQQFLEVLFHVVTLAIWLPLVLRLEIIAASSRAYRGFRHPRVRTGVFLWVVNVVICLLHVVVIAGLFGGERGSEVWARGIVLLILFTAVGRLVGRKPLRKRRR